MNFSTIKYFSHNEGRIVAKLWKYEDRKWNLLLENQI